MNILAFTNDTGSAVWRLKNPANYINALTEHEFAVTSHKNWNEDTLGADIVVAQMWQNPKGIKLCKDMGAKVVYEADDIIIGVGGKERSKLTVMTKEQEAETIESIGLADLVTVTTPVLAEHYSQYNKNVKVLPNYLDFRWWGEPPKTKRYGETIRIGWAGSYSHHEDLQMIAPIMERIIKEYPFVKFVYCGHGGMSTELGTSLNFGPDLFANIPPERREFYPGVETDFWPAKAKTLAFDIAIAPLINDEFNAGKSNIKYMEYSGNFIPGVYSDTNVYKDTVKHGVTGFLAGNEEEWFTYLSKLILDAELRKEIGKQAFLDTFKNWNLEDNYQKWVEAYQGIL